MDIQSLSIVVPTNNCCVNKCKGCVSRTHDNPYSDNVSKCFYSKDKEFGIKKNILEYQDYYNRLQFARDNGCNVVILTGTGEAPQNFRFLEFFTFINSELKTPFKWIEMQTTGVLLNYEKLKQLRWWGVTTISLSIWNIFDNEKNLELIECSKKLRFDFKDIIKNIKNLGFNLRLSLNLVNDFDTHSVSEVIDICKKLGANQITFRKLYKSETDTEIDEWIENNKSEKFIHEVQKYIPENGRYLGKLPFGALIYEIDDMSVVLDGDCMNEEIKDTYKFLILREDCHLYSRWELKGSIIF